MLTPTDPTPSQQRTHPRCRKRTEETMDELPTFVDIRANAFALLGDVEDELRSDWRSGTGPTHEQAEALQEARRAIREAMAALDKAGR